MAKSLISVNNKVTNTPPYIRKRVLTGKPLHGVNLTHTGNIPDDPHKLGADLASHGVNWARLHHLEYLTDEQIARLPGIMDILYSYGIIFSVDGCSLIGEPTGYGIDGFKQALYNEDSIAMKMYANNLSRNHAIITHPATFMCCLVNEGAHMTTPEKAERFWIRWSQYFRNISPKLLLTDCPDGFTHGHDFWEVAKSLYDVVSVHYYNDDGAGNGKGNNIYDGWNWRIVFEYMEFVGKKLFLQEFGSYKSNPHQGSNHAFVLAECLRLGISPCWFCYSDGASQYVNPNPDNVFSIVSDELRMRLLTLGGMLTKYGTKGGEVNWGGLKMNADNTGWAWDTYYKYECDRALVDQNHAIVLGSSYEAVWHWNLNEPISFLLRTP